jgi:hypothetical protein
MRLDGPKKGPRRAAGRSSGTMAVNALIRFWRFYEHSLDAQPLLTNMANTAVRTGVKHLHTAACA